MKLESKRAVRKYRTAGKFKTGVLIFALLLALAGCAKKEPTIITKTIYQEILTPVACIEKMPTKPKFNKDDLASAKELMSYFKTCEELLKGCVNGE